MILIYGIPVMSKAFGNISPFSVRSVSLIQYVKKKLILYPAGCTQGDRKKGAQRPTNGGKGNPGVPTGCFNNGGPGLNIAIPVRLLQNM